MKSEFITEQEDGKHYLMIPLGTKNYERAISKADQILNDILNCISVTEKSGLHKDSPDFLNAIKAISKICWRIL